MLNKSVTMPSGVAVFDAGIGSYLMVEKLITCYPQVDFIYLADRASFPYGLKTSEELLRCVYSAMRFLVEMNPELIIVASNVPSVTLLSILKQHFDTPIIGVYPPVQNALKLSKSRHIGVLGVKAMTESVAIQRYIEENSAPDAEVRCFNASELVNIVESGLFLRDEAGTLNAVIRFIDEILQQYPAIDTFTLSSTHLPWLESYFKRAYPHIAFVDPADDIIAALPALKSGNGTLRSLVTVCENGEFGIDAFKSMLNKLGLALNLEQVTIEQVTM